jgi:GT2 family glycosyltransferase
MPELTFPAVTQPLVSIVMLTRNDLHCVPQALQACLEHTDPVYELVVVDNASTDGTNAFLESVAGITHVANDCNYGYSVSNNLGAARAVGRYLLFLNSDVNVHPDWLPHLLAHLDRDPRVAAVAPRLLNPDGSLQLAGALLSRSGATWSYGAGDDPDRAEYSFAREVDYAAGACLLVRRSAFDAVGGFDPVFGRIYFEDADLCLRLWSEGQRTLYEPRSTATHVGGRGRPPGEDLIRLATRNRAIFERRWRTVLQSYPLSPLSTERSRIAARDARCRARVLVIGDPDCADALARDLESVRVTLTEARERAGPEWVEQLGDGAKVLINRRFHYDAIGAARKKLDDLAPLLEHTQPQAARIEINDHRALGTGAWARTLLPEVELG